MSERPIALALTGASGSAYGLRLLECLIHAGKTIYFLMSDSARAVLEIEGGEVFPGEPKALEQYLNERCQAKKNQIRVFGKQDWLSPLASGSNSVHQMVICPCSSGCVAAVAHGMSNQLIERAADVILKERRQLIVVHRETPLSTLHLENLLKLAQMGAVILPASPGFYHRPETVQDLVDFVVARILDHLGVGHDLVPRWGGVV